MENQETTNTTIEPEVKVSKLKKFFKFIISCKFFILLLLLALLAMFIWAKIELFQADKTYVSQKNEIIQNYAVKIDSLNVANIGLSMKAFSWAIRSELTRENMEQVDQLMVAFVQEPNILNIKLVNPEDYTIFLSTNKKEEGQTFADKALLAVDNSEIIKSADMVTSISPIMGLNKKLAILVIEIKR